MFFFFLHLRFILKNKEIFVKEYSFQHAKFELNLN